jgi:hypothetical protein
MRAAAWHKQGIVVVPLEDIYDDWDRAFLTGIATTLYGARTATTKHSRPWREGEVIDRGDGETWTVVATTGKSVTVQRSRVGALATLGQLGEARPWPRGRNAPRPGQNANPVWVKSTSVPTAV